MNGGNIVDFSKSMALQRKSHELIPGGCHTYAKGDDQYPELAPGFIVRGDGCHVWDVDGNEYIEYGMGNRTVTLGHAYPAVVEAARREMLNGANYGRPSPIEVDCAEAFLGMVPGADMVKFCKDGSDANSAALRLARAVSGRDLIGICSDHPFFAIDDWFIGKTPINAGVPQAVKDLIVQFRYNDIDNVRALFDAHPGQIAALIMEPAKYEDPADNFLHKTLDLCHSEGALLILDEMITGYRWHNGGAQTLYDIVPDLSTFGKAMGNGFAVSALAGKREHMQRGGLTHDKERVFLLSTTHGGETHALAAAMAVMHVYQQEPVIETMERQGARLKDGLDEAIRRHQLDDYVEIFGRSSCLVYATRNEDREPSQAFRALFMQEMIKRGIIGPSLVISYSHSDADIQKTIDCLDDVLKIYAKAINDGVERHLIGRPLKIVYRRYN